MIAPQGRPLLLGALLCALTWGGPPAAGAQDGDPARGRQLFTARQCARCHAPRAGATVGPPLPQLRRPQGAYELAGRLWNHAPAMFTALVQERIPWPRFEPAEMQDLMAYLGADPRRDPPPDPGKGHVVLVARGCLKCHTWHGEGHRIGPDLAERREAFAPASRWAATLWSHAPRMAAVAIERGILYPRFSGDEMAHLVAFLRSRP